MALVGIMISDYLANSVMFCESVNDRLMYMRLQCSPLNLFIISCYAPIESAAVVVKDNFYDEVVRALRVARQSDFLVLAGDFNAQLGVQSAQEKSVIGPFSIGQRTDNGDRLISVPDFGSN